MGHCKVSQQNRGSDPEDEGGDGVLQQGHRGEDLQELEVLGLGYLSRRGETAVLMNKIILDMFLLQ